MVNALVERLRGGGGEIVQISIDLSAEQLLAVAHATEGVVTDRYAAAALDADAVLELRALVALHDQSLERARDGDRGATLALTVEQLGRLVRALRDWLARREQLGFLRAQEALDTPLVENLADELTDTHVYALRVALNADAHACSLG